MNGAQDMGGLHGFGPIDPEPDEPVFHADWERRAFALTLAMGKPGGWTIDMSRAARESLPPVEYLSKSYYEIWLAGLEKLASECGLLTPGEIAAGHALAEPRGAGAPLRAEDVAVTLGRGGPTEREATAPARFGPGDRVRARNMHPLTHTRLPRYVRGRVGVVEATRGCHVFPDSSALGAGENPHWLYTVRFEGRELWGDETDPSVSVSVDAWEPYLETA